MSTQITSNQIWFAYFPLSGPTLKNHFALGHCVLCTAMKHVKQNKKRKTGPQGLKLAFFQKVGFVFQISKIIYTELDI